MRIVHKDLVLYLRPLCKDDLPTLVKSFSSMKIHMYTRGLFGQTLESETEWYENKRKSSSDCVWAIQPVGSDVPIGVTAIHDLTLLSNTCTTGIIIWDQNWWGRGVASATHLARTMFAADYLNQFMIKSTVIVPNEASRRALERVGYTICGKDPRTVYRGGVWLDEYHLVWLHPNMISYYYPEGLPEQYEAGVERAKKALEIARAEVDFN